MSNLSTSDFKLANSILLVKDDVSAPVENKLAISCWKQALSNSFW